MNRQATAGAPAPAPLPPPEMTQSPENALLSGANLAVAGGPGAPATPSFATDSAATTAAPTFMGDGTGPAAADGGADGASSSSSSSWLSWFGGKKSESA